MGAFMNTAITRAVGTIGLLSISAVSLAGQTTPATPHEPVGFVTGAVIGAFAAGPVGAVVGAGLGTWLGNRVHRAKDATRAEATAAALQAGKTKLLGENSALSNEKQQLTDTNVSLSARLDELTHQVQTAQNAKQDASSVLDGLQGDVLF